MYKTDDVKQKLIDYMMGMDLGAMSLADINLYTLILSQLALTDKHEISPFATFSAGLGSTIAALPVPEEAK